MHPELRAAVNKARGSETAQARSSNSKQLVVYDADTVKPEPVEWLWPGRIAIGKTTLVGGDPGLGKSQLSIFILANWPMAVRRRNTTEAQRHHVVGRGA